METILNLFAYLLAAYLGWILVLCRRALSKYLQAKEPK